MTKDRTIADASATSPDAADRQHGVIGADEYLPPVYAPTGAGLYDAHHAAVSFDELGRRAAKLRADRDMSTAELAARAGVSVADVDNFERGGITDVMTMLAVHRVLSGDMALQQLFATPRFETIEDVVAYEARRRSA